MEVLHAICRADSRQPEGGQLYHVHSLAGASVRHALARAGHDRGSSRRRGFLAPGLGSMLESFNLHLLRSSDWRRRSVEFQGSALPESAVVVSPFPRHRQGGRFQKSFSDKWLIRPLHMLRWSSRRSARGLPARAPASSRGWPRYPGSGCSIRSCRRRPRPTPSPEFG